MTTDSKQTMAVAMSGGVDSSVTALLLQQQGYRIFGLFMKNWEQDDEGGCSAAADMADAKAVCQHLAIPFHTVNLSQAYWQDVFEYFLAEYQAGRTPNPDILCNKYIKFDAFWQHAKTLGATHMATGHYVRTQHHNSETYLLRGLDHNKDQSYFLHALNQTQLRHSLFPLGELAKSTVRALAQQAGLINHNKKDSTGICFIGERKFQNFLNQYLLNQPGPIKTASGQIIGQHQGLMFHTLGQRKGLHIGGLSGHSEAPWYVARKDTTNNTLVVVQGREHPLLYQQDFYLTQMHWINPKIKTVYMACEAQIRYQQAAQPCILQQEANKRWHVSFKVPQWAVTPGQSAVFYKDEQCLGGGVIAETALKGE